MRKWLYLGFSVHIASTPRMAKHMIKFTRRQDYGEGEEWRTHHGDKGPVISDVDRHLAKQVVRLRHAVSGALQNGAAQIRRGKRVQVHSREKGADHFALLRAGTAISSRLQTMAGTILTWSFAADIRAV